MVTTLSRVLGFLWHSFKWACRFGRFLQYTSGLEVFDTSFDADFNYVITMFQLRPFLNHWVKFQQLVGGRSISKWHFREYSQRYIRNPSIALSWTRGPQIHFPAKCVNLWDPKLSSAALAFLCCHYMEPYFTCLTVNFNTVYAHAHSH